MYAYIMSHRTQIVLTDAQYQRLSDESQRTGASLGSLVRSAVDQAVESAQANRAEALDASFGAWSGTDRPDGEAWVESMRPGTRLSLAYDDGASA